MSGNLPPHSAQIASYIASGFYLLFVILGLTLRDPEARLGSICGAFLSLVVTAICFGSQ